MAQAALLLLPSTDTAVMVVTRPKLLPLIVSVSPEEIGLVWNPSTMGSAVPSCTSTSNVFVTGPPEHVAVMWLTPNGANAGTVIDRLPYASPSRPCVTPWISTEYGAVPSESPQQVKR